MKKILNRLSLQTVLTIPFVIQVIAVVGIVGYLSFRNGQAAVNSLASQLRRELSDRILQQLKATLERPYLINQLNASALLQGDINVPSGQGESQLWQQAKVFPSVNLIYCATEQEGTFLGVGRADGGLGKSLQIQSVNQSTGHHMYYYEIDAVGRRSSLSRKGEKWFDPRTRPWYQAAKAQRKATWSEVYLDFDVMLPTISAATPVYRQPDQKLLGVCATDIILSEELNTFLKNLQISRSGIAFILKPNGLLVASSTSDAISTGQGEKTHLLLASQSPNPLIQGATHYLTQQFQGLNQVQSSQLSFFLKGKRQYLAVERFYDQQGLDWIVVLAVPEDDFMEQIHKNTQITLLLCLIALLVAILIGLVTTKWLTQPLLQLSTTAKNLAQGKWDQAIELDRSDAIGELSRALAQMAQQLNESFATLEKRVEERTSELIQLNQKLQQLAEVDGLTEVANRRYFDLYLDKEWHRLTREAQPLTLLMCDVDFFKKYNDSYGHQAGDRCLKQVAQVLRQSIQRPADLVARYGGEEFVILLPNTDQNGGTHLAEQISHLLQARHIPHEASHHPQVTLSIGIATMIPSPDQVPESLIAAADRALYTAKEQGRNCYQVEAVGATCETTTEIPFQA